MFDALIVVNGEIPQPSSWRDLPYRTLICTDGAANFLSQLTITPDIIIGDMDSISVGTQFATAKLLKMQFPDSKIDVSDDQYTTDFEKVLLFAKQNAFKRIICVGALGKAADHAVYNLSLIARYQTYLDITLLNIFDDQRQWIFPMHSKTCISTIPQALISLFPLTEVTVTTSGLKWELNNEKLAPLGKGTIRNLTLKSEIVVDSTGPCLCFLTCEAPPIITFPVRS